MTSVRSAALISLHTSPLHQPGSGDAGGMNVYLAHVARELAALGVAVDIFTRADAQTGPGVTELAPGARVVSLDVAPGASKTELSAHAGEFAEAVLAQGFGPYGVVHAHYWLSGLAGERLAEAWSAPLIHTMHTLALAKERGNGSGEPSEPDGRASAERGLIERAARLIVNTRAEARDVEELYGADPARVDIVAPGVDLGVFTPEGRREARARHGIAEDEFHVLFAGRIQRLKGPQVLVEAMSRIPESAPIRLSIVGAASGAGELDLAGRIAELGLEDRVSLHAPVEARRLADWYRAADVVAMPSYAESFGLVALEAQACGTPVIAAEVGGLPQSVSDGRTGLLLPDHDPERWADAIVRIAADGALREQLTHAAPIHARAFGWQRTAMFTLQSYRVAAGL